MVLPGHIAAGKSKVQSFVGDQHGDVATRAAGLDTGCTPRATPTPRATCLQPGRGHGVREAPRPQPLLADQHRDVCLGPVLEQRVALQAQGIADPGKSSRGTSPCRPTPDPLPVAQTCCGWMSWFSC